MLDRGVYLAPSAFEAGFVSLAHRRRELDATLEAARAAFRHGGARRLRPPQRAGRRALRAGAPSASMRAASG